MSCEDDAGGASSPLPTGEGGAHRESDGRVRVVAASSRFAVASGVAATALTPTLSRGEREKRKSP
jgi:hypothetical protein